jgi:hypothetical protein
MRGPAVPDPDDPAILDRDARSQDPEGLGTDRMLRVKTLEATLADPGGGAADARLAAGGGAGSAGVARR